MVVTISKDQGFRRMLEWKAEEIFALIFTSDFLKKFKVIAHHLSNKHSVVLL